jgi:alpha-beta hydrolase superfamily lysophospholipase
MKRGLIAASAALLVAAAFAPFALAWYASELFLRPAWYLESREARVLRPSELVDPQASFGLGFEDVAFPAIDGSTLRGWFVPAARPTRTVIVTAHGGGSDRRSFLGLVPALHAAGYPVLLFDCREHGLSDGEARGMSLGMRESADLVSALDFLEARGSDSYAALGSSQGASSVILAAAVDERIQAVVAQGTGTTLYEMMRANARLEPFPDWWVRLFERTVGWRTGPPWHDVVADGPNPIDAIGRITPRAVLLIQGSEDEMAPVEQARENFRRAGEPKELWIVKGARHNDLRDVAGPEYERRVLAFLLRHSPP